MPKRRASDGTWLTLVEDESGKPEEGIYVLTVTWLDSAGNLRGFADQQMNFEDALAVIAGVTTENVDRVNYICLNKLNAELSK